MTHLSTAELEREAEAARQRVAYTAETLKHKMSLGQIVDEAADYLRHSDGSMALHNLRVQVRDNPLPLALVGAGLAWFFMGGGPTTDRMRRAAEGYASRDDRYVPDLWAGQAAGDQGSRDWEDSLGVLGGPESDHESGNGHGGRGVMSAVSDTASTISEAAGSAYASAGDAAASAGERAARTAAMARRRAARTGTMMVGRSTEAGRRVRRTFLDVLDQEPLVLGAIGIAVGAAIAAMLPRTRYEDETIGPYRDQIRDEAKEAVAQGVEQAKDIASETYEAVKDEAERQGLTSGGDRPIAERVADIAKSAAETAEESTRSRVES